MFFSPEFFFNRISTTFSNSHKKTLHKTTSKQISNNINSLINRRTIHTLPQIFNEIRKNNRRFVGVQTLTNTDGQTFTNTDIIVSCSCKNTSNRKNDYETKRVLSIVAHSEFVFYLNTFFSIFRCITVQAFKTKKIKTFNNVSIAIVQRLFRILFKSVQKKYARHHIVLYFFL